MRYSDMPEGETLQKFLTYRYRRNHRRTTTALVAMWVLSSACDGPAPVAAESVPFASDALTCAEDGRLTVELYGSIRASLDWQSDELDCTGMPRPDDEGARVRLAGPLGPDDDARTLAFILGLPDLEIGRTGAELATNVTLIEEGTGRFYGSRDNGDCWTDVSHQDLIGAPDERSYRIEGTLYCISPLAELNGNTSVSFTDLKFIGLINWEQPE